MKDFLEGFCIMLLVAGRCISLTASVYCVVVFGRYDITPIVIILLALGGALLSSFVISRKGKE